MENIKETVRDRYNQIAKQNRKQEGCACGCECGGSVSDIEYTFIGDDYQQVEGHFEDADLGLGCGIPTEDAAITPGDTVLDLGSGAGNDCFIARAIVGDQGHVIGLDFADEMLRQANINAKKLGFSNVEFIKGDIENIPLSDGRVDVIISNCVLNLVPDKQKAFNEMYRVTRQGGHFCVSDVVIKGELPVKLKQDAVMYAGCVAGAIPKAEYLEVIRKAGFDDIIIKKEKEVILPDEILGNYFSAEELNEFRNSGTGLFSITVFAVKKIKTP